MHQPGTNIRTLRQQLGLNITQFAKLAETDVAQLSRIETGKGGYSAQGLERIAKALNVSVGTLFADGMTIDAAAIGVRRVPVLSDEQIARWSGPDNADWDLDTQEFVYMGLNISRYVFATRILSEANAPQLMPEDVILFDPTCHPGPRDIVIGKRGDGTVTIGRFRLHETASENPMFEVVPVDAFYPPISSIYTDLRLLGVMIEQRRPRAGKRISTGINKSNL
jgi:transcriptional regulator with XRE-family HTH domain